MSNPVLRRGDLVDVKGPAEIQATLDESGGVGGLPFMPEMSLLCGKRFVVDRRAERICDTIEYTGSRRVRDAVLLDDPRCDGSAHGGCQADCRTFWKECWLRKVAPDTSPAPAGDGPALEALVARISRHQRYTVDVEGRPQERWRCQATELQRASEHLELWDPRGYVRELRCRNVDLGHFLRVMSRAAVMEPMRKLGLVAEVHLPGTRTQPVADLPLNLQPGELVQVKTREEIAETLTPQGRHKGLWFDREMLPFCGGTYRVRHRVTRLLDERDGRMVEFKTDCVSLEGVVCSGVLSLRRWFCSRAIYSLWRECWLRRAETPTAQPRNEGR
jgi:hypothetical protein